MMMEEAFAAYLVASGDLAAIVGQRIDWAIRPQAEATPAITLHNITSFPVYADEGDTGLSYARIQTDSWAKTYAEAKAAARAITERLNSNGSKFVQSGIEFQISYKADEQDSFERGAAAESLYRVRQDFDIWFKEEN